MSTKLKLELLKSIANAYLNDPAFPTWNAIQKKFNVGHRTITAAQALIPTETLRAGKSLRYSRSKLGNANPMTGRFEELHHNWKGECSDQQGYITLRVGKGRTFKHRLIMCRALMLEKLPEGFIVHHVDGDPTNNDINNLALMTRKAHTRLHQDLDHLKRLCYKRLSIWEKAKSGTSRLRRTILISPED